MDRIRKLVAYRNHAEELRRLVDDFSDAECQRMLNKLADEYDRMAGTLEDSLREKPPVF